MLRQMRSFFEIRRRVKTQMLRFADLKWRVASIFDDEPIAVADRAAFAEAQTIFGDLSDELIAFGQSRTLAASLVTCSGMDPTAAGRSLATLADDLGARNEDRDANYHAVSRLLRFQICSLANDANQPNRSSERLEERRLGSARIGQDYGRHLEQQADQAKLYNDTEDEW
jgi:hypothetical protein